MKRLSKLSKYLHWIRCKCFVSWNSSRASSRLHFFTFFKGGRQRCICLFVYVDFIRLVGENNQRKEWGMLLIVALFDLITVPLFIFCLFTFNVYLIKMWSSTICIFLLLAFFVDKSKDLFDSFEFKWNFFCFKFNLKFHNFLII